MVQMTNGEDALPDVSGIQPAGRSARASIATSARCSPASLTLRGMESLPRVMSAKARKAASGPVSQSDVLEFSYLSAFAISWSSLLTRST